MKPAAISKPSQFYSGQIWRLGLMFARFLPASILSQLAKFSAAIYWRFAAHRREIVIQNLLPALNDRKLAVRAARELFVQFALKIADLWRFESGVAFNRWTGEWNGWEHFLTAHARGKGVLLVTPHLGNWEFGGAFLVEHGYKLLVLTQPEPDARLTELRQASRAQRGIETLVVGEDAFAFVEIIKRLQEGATVALLVDRPPAPTAVNVELFGQPFPASIAAAELARASGCAIVPGYIVRRRDRHLAHVLPEITYDRAAIGNREGRVQLTQEILRAFEPAIRQHLTQLVSLRPRLAGDGKEPSTNIQASMKLQIPNFKYFRPRPQRLGAWCLALLWSLELGIWSFPARADETDSVLDAWFAAQTNLHTWSADFAQTRTLKALTQPLVTDGHLYFSAPNEFRWELGQPAQTIALRHADEMFVIYPRLKRAERYPIGAAAPSTEWRDTMSLLQAGFPGNRNEFDAQFQIMSLTETNGAWQLDLQPKSVFARRMMPELRIGLATNNFSLASTELIFMDGSRMRNDFTNAVLNPTLDESLFQWSPPADFKVSEPMKR